MTEITPDKRLLHEGRILDIESVIDVKRIINAGTLRDRVTVQVREPGEDGFGEPNGAWINEATLWAYVEPLRGVERFESLQQQPAVDIRVTLRGRGNETREIYCKESV